MDESLYYAELKLLTTYCKPCLDNKMKDKLLLYLFKQTLYNRATELGLEEDAEQYYNEMLNLLDMRKCECSINNKCENGYCSICN